MPKAAGDNNLLRKILKYAAIVLGCLLGLILIATVLLLTLLEPYAESYLKDQVAKKTDGLYTLEFKDIDINLFTTSIDFTELHLYPDSSVHRQQREQGKAKPYLFEVSAPELVIARIDLMAILFNKHLDIGTISMEKPEITILHDSQVKQESNNGGSSLGKFIESFHVGEIHIPDAIVRHLTLDQGLEIRQVIPDVSLRVLDLETDSLQHASYSRTFNADDIQLRVEDYTYLSPDSVYAVRVGLLTYSTKSEELTAESVEVRTDQQAYESLDKAKANQTIYGVKAPRLLITGLDLVEAYRTKKLHIDEVLLEQALVDILENRNIPANTKFPELTNLYELVSPFLIEIVVDNFSIANGSLKYRSMVEEVVIIHELDDADISLREIQIDSATLFSPNSNFYAEEILISTEGYTYKHPRSPYTIKVPSLELSTIDRFLQADSVQIIGDWGKNDSLKQSGHAHYTIYNLSALSVRFNDMDLIEALKTQKLEIGSIVVREPYVDLLWDKNVEKADYDNWLKSTYQQVSGFVNEVSVKEISFLDASFTQHIKKQQVKLRQKLEQASLLATGLHVDSSFIFQSQAKLPLDELKLRAEDYTYWLADNIHLFHLEKLRYSTRTEVLSARAVALTSNRTASNRLREVTEAGSDLYDVSASLFRVTGLDLIKAINTEQLALDELVLKQPLVAIFQDKDAADQASGQGQSAAMQGLFKLVSPITINTVRLQDGTFVLRQKQDTIVRTQLLEHLTARLEGVKLNPDQLSSLRQSLPVQAISFTASDYTYRSPNGIYTITLDSLEYESDQQLLTARIFNVDVDTKAHERLKLIQPEEANRNLFDISAQKLVVTGLNLVQAYESGRFNMEEVLLTEPEVTIIQDQNIADQQPQEKAEKDASTESKTLEQVAKIVETFRIENLRIKDGTFKVSILKDTTRISQVIKLVSVNIEELRLASLKASDPLDMFTVDELEVLIKDYTYLLPDSMYRFEVATVRSSLRKETLTIDSLRLIPLYNKDKFNQQLTYEKDRYEITVPKIKMLGMDLSALYNKQNFIVEEMQVLEPELNIYRDKGKPRDPERSPGTLQDALLNADLYIRADTINIISGKLTYEEVPEKGDEPGILLLDEVNITLANITNDSLLIKKKPLAVADASTLFLGHSKLKVFFTFHLDHPDDYHTYEGSLEPMNFEAFNPLLENLMFMRVESGFINGAEFAVEATAQKAEGHIKFLYENLEVQLLNKDKSKKPGFLLNAGTWLINTFVVKSNNPSRLGNYRKGPIETERDHRKSIFNLMSTAMIDGMASSLMPNLVEKILGTFTDIP